VVSVFSYRCVVLVLPVFVLLGDFPEFCGLWGWYNTVFVVFDVYYGCWVLVCFDVCCYLLCLF